ncbi:unnamed protein product, partial [Somion occarium]
FTFLISASTWGIAWNHRDNYWASFKPSPCLRLRIEGSSAHYDDGEEGERDSVQSHLTALPTELLVHVLSLLDGLETVRCKRICRYLKSIIDDNALLQCKIELHAAGYVDIPKPGLSVADRLDAFRRSQRAWRNPRPRCIVAGRRTDIPSNPRSMVILYNQGFHVDWQRDHTSTADHEFTLEIVDMLPVLQSLQPKFTPEPLSIPAHEGLQFMPDMDLMLVVQSARFSF